jgi:hypothetical protein
MDIASKTEYFGAEAVLKNRAKRVKIIPNKKVAMIFILKVPILLKKSPLRLLLPIPYGYKSKSI